MTRRQRLARALRVGSIVGLACALLGGAPLVSVGCAACPQARADGELLSRDDAVDIARRAIAGKARITPASELIVEVGPDVIVVIWRTPLEPHTRGPDYDARVTVDRRTAAVLEVLVGS